MSKGKRRFIKAMLNRTLVMVGVLAYGLVMLNTRTHQTNYVTSVNGVKSIEAYHMINRYDNRSQTLSVLHVDTMQEAAMYGASMPISFTGQMTAYKATCKGCTGKVSCPPRQNVTNGNIWFNDSAYGRVRILAADPNIPCGTIVKITNVTFSNEEIIGIVLDRGGAIKGNIMDFLVSEEDNMDVVGRQHNVNYEVLRWGW